jgi:hypothetical protein
VLAVDAGTTVPAEAVAAVTVPAETVAAATIAAETVDVAASPLVLVPVAVPLAPYPEPARRPRTARPRTVWLAALAVGSVLLAGGILRTVWPGSDDSRTNRDALAASSGASPARAAGQSDKPAAPSASAPANPSLDSCVVGTWRMTSMQLVNTIDGVKRRFTSSGGVVTRIWPDGKSVDNYAKAAPLTATIGGAKWSELFRGVEKSYTETRNGRMYTSEITGNKTVKVTRNGKVRPFNQGVNSSYDLPYICSETRLTTYGNEKVSTQSFQRVSHSP